MSITAKLRTWKKKTITSSELAALMRSVSDAELYRLVSEAVDEGVLSPVKASGTNGNRVYPVYLKYRITVDEDYSDALSEISMLHPSITKSGYLQSKPALYVRYRDQLQKLNQYLFKSHPAVSVSKKERSFEVFDEEKQLEDSSFKTLLERLGLNRDVLCYYDTPEYCFNDYIPVRKSRMVLLICENKDIWFNIRRRMYEDGASSVFDISIDGVVYGCGNKVSEAGALSEYTRFMGTEDVQYLYWGDIDRAGLNIYLSLIKNNPELNVRLFKPAYEAMLQLAGGHAIPDSQDHRSRTGDYELIYELFDEQTRELLQSYIEANKRIPQEIISYAKLLEVMR